MVKSAKCKLTSMKVMKAVSMKAAASTTQMKAMKAASAKSHIKGQSGGHGGEY